ncbi:hypothetical protein EDB86DRAFT_1003670 [Lactarius hatsudake]|nr:hypothetical protein EDB86DRAFT_1003670 [Lactarius hatsudake]
MGYLRACFHFRGGRHAQARALFLQIRPGPNQGRAGRLESETNGGQIVAENFAQLIILPVEATNKRELVNYVDHPRTWNFFREGPILTTDEFLPDLDTTSVGLMVTQPDDHVFDSVMDEILQYTTTDRIPMTYFDAERTRTDPVVCLNSPTPLLLTWVRTRALAHARLGDSACSSTAPTFDGTRYYETAECFLFFAAQFLRATPDPNLHARHAQLLRARIIKERTGAASGDSARGKRRRACASRTTSRTSCRCSARTGGWGPSWIYKYGSSGVKIGNRGPATALVLNAVSALRRPPQPPEPLWISEKRRLLPVDLPFSPLLPLLFPVAEWTSSMGTVVKAVYAYVFAAARTSTCRLVQDPDVDVCRHERWGSIGAG